MKPVHAARKFEISGIVQGVGFRPHVYQLARRHGLTGQVSNTGRGVSIWAVGPESGLEAFGRDLTAHPPPLARITAMEVSPAPVADFSEFAIVESREGPARNTLIAPDVSICDDCHKELFDPRDRRFRYPFINCTNCGPRFTIIEAIPYDRPFTTMKHFAMCDACRAEYENPQSRRFHAQPNACPDCGPRALLLDARRRPAAGSDPIARAARLLQEGHIVAVKGLGGFHLACDAENHQAVVRLRARKHREEKPLALMAASLDAIGAFARPTPEEEALAASRERPIVLMAKREPNPISPAVAPANPCFGVMLPYTPLHCLLLADKRFTALVMTSGNTSAEPMAITNGEAFHALAGIADYFLVHDRDIFLRCDDSIVRKIAGETRFLRRSRGYVPVPVFLGKELPSVLAVGGELKNALCLTKGDQAVFSQHIGDLENLKTHEAFEAAAGHLQRILSITPLVVAHDLHPDYFSTRFARSQTGLPPVGVQHHHAHIAAGMAEHRLDGPVIGLAFDGTGLGTDGTIWGGEVLIAEYHRFERAGSLAPLAMPGGAAAIREPWRMGLSHLLDALGEEALDLPLPLFASLAPDRVGFVADMIRKKVNTPLTSSLGRLFDAVAAIIGLRGRASFEGQAAMELEAAGHQAFGAGEASYDFGWETRDRLRILTAPIIQGVVADVLAGVSPALISARFHRTLVRLFGEVCEAVRRQSGLDQVVLGGGVFQNPLLLAGLQTSLENRGFTVFAPALVPAGDGGLALGQAAVAAGILARN